MKVNPAFNGKFCCHFEGYVISRIFFFLFQIDEDVGVKVSGSSTLNFVEEPVEQIPKIEKRKEKWYFKLIQIVIPFLIAGLGMVGAGVLFSFVSVCTIDFHCRWPL